MYALCNINTQRGTTRCSFRKGGQERFWTMQLGERERTVEQL